jgi:hypothetical protein
MPQMIVLLFIDISLGSSGGWGIGPSQGLNKHKETETLKYANLHPCSKWDWESQTKCSKGIDRVVIVIGHLFVRVKILKGLIWFFNVTYNF